jgi:hypothetical protein
MVQAHKEVRSAEESPPRPRRPWVPEVVTFTACEPTELAWEKDGRGEFTLRATRLLAAGTAGWTNAELQRQVTAAFGAGAQADAHAGLFAGRAGVPAPAAAPGAGRHGADRRTHGRRPPPLAGRGAGRRDGLKGK